MTQKVFNFADRLLKNSFFTLLFLTPLILTPWNFELFEFNKMLFVFLLTALTTSAWVVKMLLAKKIIFQKTPLDLPLLAFLISQVFSTFLSLDPHTSLWGYYSRAHGGLISTFSYLLLYWALVSNLNPQEALTAVRYLLTSAFLVAGYGFLEHFGIDKNYWLQDVQNRVFSTLGQPNWLAAYLTALAFLPLAFILRRRKIASVYSLLFTLIYLCLLYTKSRSGLLAFGLSYALFWFLVFFPNFKKITQKRIQDLLRKPIFKKFFLLTAILLVFALIIPSPLQEKALSLVTRQPLPQVAPGLLISKSSDIRQIVWQGAIDIWKAYPVFGSGVETFAYSYYNFRPAEHNLVSEWDFLYNKAHNEYLNFLATTGAFGLFTYLLFIVVSLFFLLKKIGQARKALPRLLLAAFFAGFASLLVAHFFGFSVVTTALFFFLFPALAFKLTQDQEEPLLKPSPTFSFSQKIGLGLITLFLLFSFSLLVKIWLADYYYNLAHASFSDQEFQKAFDQNQIALSLRPSEPLFHDQQALNAASLAQEAFAQKDATQSAHFAQIAIEESSQTLTMNPFHLNFWKNRARVFLKLGEITPDFKLEALEALLQATELAPTDAKIYYNLALIYGQLGQKQTAIETLKKTIDLKPNYKNARLALALYLQEKGETPAAKQELEYIINQIDPTDESLKKLLEEW